MNELYHHGILGQKWGIRRYQNPDGTLTEEGKERVRKHYGNGYLNPGKDDRKAGKAKNRDDVAMQYRLEYWKALDKGMPRNGPSDKGRKLWNKYKDKYASAYLKDIRLKDTDSAREFVKQFLSENDEAWDYDHPKFKD